MTEHRAAFQPPRRTTAPRSVILRRPSAARPSKDDRPRSGFSYKSASTGRRCLFSRNMGPITDGAFPVASRALHLPFCIAHRHNYAEHRGHQIPRIESGDVPRDMYNDLTESSNVRLLKNIAISHFSDNILCCYHILNFHEIIRREFTLTTKLGLFWPQYCRYVNDFIFRDKWNFFQSIWINQHSGPWNIRDCWRTHQFKISKRSRSDASYGRILVTEGIRRQRLELAI